jgi:hypothetical protein
MRTPLDECLRKFVVVEASGVKYLGTLIEVGEEEVILKTPARWIGVPIDRITYIREFDPAKLENPEVEHVDAEDFVAAEPAAPGDAAALGEAAAPGDAAAPGAHAEPEPTDPDEDD